MTSWRTTSCGGVVLDLSDIDFQQLVQLVHPDVVAGAALQAPLVWAIVTVQSILDNDFYIGTLRQGKYTRKKINGKGGADPLAVLLAALDDGPDLLAGVGDGHLVDEELELDLTAPATPSNNGKAIKPCAGS